MDISNIAKELGKRGGIKTSERHTPDDYRRWQAKGVASRLKRRKTKLLLDKV